MNKKIKLILYVNEELQEYDEEIIITKDNSYSLQNEGDPYPAVTIAMDKNGNLLLNTNSPAHIQKKAMEVKA